MKRLRVWGLRAVLIGFHGLSSLLAWLGVVSGRPAEWAARKLVDLTLDGDQPGWLP